MLDTHRNIFFLLDIILYVFQGTENIFRELDKHNQIKVTILLVSDIFTCISSFNPPNYAKKVFLFSFLQMKKSRLREDEELVPGLNGVS